MPDKLSDRTVILAIALTILLLFGLIFSTRPPGGTRESPLLWRDSGSTDPSPSRSTGTLQI